ncbi:hypothetical protein GQ55_1G254700 [Panicum hallii var. hallii]|uniref:Ubiquitin-like protease family profile domain-containing protein n=1 Tax=Panicum hallii var. hallii TaxID=1504633 RepID=A0A2T7F7D9_9POAL|nr:hypothetical protein GQ55_1G254700 [Panicum hallii var. hallii]
MPDDEKTVVDDKISAAGIEKDDNGRRKKRTASQSTNQSDRPTRLRTIVDQTAPKIKPRKEPPNETVSKTYDLAIECKEQVLLRFGEISMTGSEVEQSFKGGEDACHLINGPIKCIKKDALDHSRIFISPVKKDDQDIKGKIKLALPKAPTELSNKRGGVKFPHRYIFLPVFLSDECIVICFQLKNAHQISVVCSKDVFNSNGRVFLSLGDNLDKAIEECGYNKIGISSVKPSHVPLSNEPNESVFSVMFFLYKFQGKIDGELSRCSERDREWLSEFIRVYNGVLLEYLISHEENTASSSLPTEISVLIKRSSR